MAISPADPLLVKLHSQLRSLLGILKETGKISNGELTSARTVLKNAVLKIADLKEPSEEQKLLAGAVVRVLPNFKILAENDFSGNLSEEKFVRDFCSFIILPIFREIQKSKDVRLKALARDILAPFIVHYEETFKGKLS